MVPEGFVTKDRKYIFLAIGSNEVMFSNHNKVAKAIDRLIQAISSLNSTCHLYQYVCGVLPRPVDESARPCIKKFNRGISLAVKNLLTKHQVQHVRYLPVQLSFLQLPEHQMAQKSEPQSGQFN